MKNRIVLAALATTLIVGCQSTSSETQSTTTSNTTNSYSTLTSAALTTALQVWGQQSTTTSSTASTLASSIQQAANVTTEQATGGVGSLLALAQNNLSTTQNTELGSLIPGYDTLKSTGLTSLITNSSAVDTAFSALGMDSSMVSTFAPIMLNSLQSQGASSSLVSALGSIWQ